MRAGIYLRVSTDDQTTDNQRAALTAMVERRGWTLAEIYRDHALSGMLPGEKRPGFNKMLGDVRKGRMDVIVAWSIDRLGRSTLDLHVTLAAIHAAKVNIVLYEGDLDTTTPQGELMFSIMAVFAQFERRMISERVKAGLSRARIQGKRLGPPRKPTSTAEQVDNLIRSTSLRIADIADMCGVSVSYVEKRSKNIPDAEKLLRKKIMVARLSE